MHADTIRTSFILFRITKNCYSGSYSEISNPGSNIWETGNILGGVTCL